jgi:hypothetical protein
MLIMAEDNQDMPSSILQLLTTYILPTPATVKEAAKYSGASSGVTEKDFFINYLQTG